MPQLPESRDDGRGPDGRGEARAAHGGPLPLQFSRLLAAFLIVNALLLGPRWLASGSMGPEWVALDGLALVAFVSFFQWPWRRRASGVVACAAVSLALLGLADAAMRLSLGRPLNLALDLPLLRSVHHLLAGIGGSVGGFLLLFGLVLVAALAAWALHRLLASTGDGPRRRHGGGGRARFVLALVAVAMVGLGGWLAPPSGGRLAFPASRLIAEQARLLAETWRERERFAREIEAARERSAARPPGLLGRLEDTDVIVGFIESYGISAIRDPRYAPVLEPRLRDMEERLGSAGLHVATGTLRAPTRGGQSWLAHGSMLSGTWIDSQLRYDLFLASGAESLVHDFRRAGHRTAAVMPAMTMPWPEGERLGFEESFLWHDMEYEGPALNWVTMPDQYTWWFFESRVRSPSAPHQPLFAVLALISSHAPWTPILPVLDRWDAIGDGSVFARWEDAGERPEELWRDPERVREHYALSVEYAVHAMAAYAERFVDERTLLVALGDHQPAPLVTGEGASDAVPVHVVSGDRRLLEPFLEAGFREGAFPDPAAAPEGMDAFRRWFVGAFSLEDGG